MAEPKFNPKTGRWDARVSISRRGMPRQQLRNRTSRTKGEAQKWMRDQLRAVDKGTYVTTEKATVEELFAADCTLQVKLGKMRLSTAANYRRQAAKHVTPAIGGIRAADLRPGDLDKLYGDLLDAGLAPSTVRLISTMLSGSFRRATKRGAIAVNPCTNASPPDGQVLETVTWTLEQTQRFFSLDVVRADSLYPMLRIMAATGVRRGEALALGWADVDLENGTFDVKHSAALVDGEVVIGPPKTRRSARRVTIGADSIQLLHDHRAAQQKRRRVMGFGWHDHGLVFPGIDGRPRNPASVSTLFATLVAKTDLPRVVLHSLRHAHGTLCLDRGMPAHAVAARMGHSPATLLKIYAHTGDRSQDAAAGFESLLDGDEPAALTVVGGVELDDDPEEPETLVEPTGR